VEIRFDECAINTDTRLVQRRGQSIQVSPKAFELLEILIMARPRVVP
jgi:DNA-binding winged helix-turn-helix (wHTH) protein